MSVGRWDAVVLSATVLAAACSGASADYYDGWSHGRATFYGENDGMSIHSGSCMFGTLDGSKGTGWDITALSDTAHDYSGSCGTCYEVACRPSHIKDGYGENMDRTGSCRGGSVIVRVTDTCPCHYPSNAYSNTRWCCGDNYHMDLSKWAFEKIGDMGAGAIGIYYRRVGCPGETDGSGWSQQGGDEGGQKDDDYYNNDDGKKDDDYNKDDDKKDDYYDKDDNKDGYYNKDDSGGDHSNNGDDYKQDDGDSHSGDDWSSSSSSSSSHSSSSSSSSPSSWSSNDGPGWSWSSASAWSSSSGGSWDPAWPNRGLRRQLMAAEAAAAGILPPAGAGAAVHTLQNAP